MIARQRHFLARFMDKWRVKWSAFGRYSEPIPSHEPILHTQYVHVLPENYPKFAYEV